MPVCGSGGLVCSSYLLIRRAQRARCQAEIPPIVLSKFPGPALTFSIVIATETFLAMPLGGYLVDRSSPKWACIGGPLIAIGWYFDSIADALYLFYVAAVIIGLGTGLVFAAAYGNAPKWFPDKR